MRIEIKISGPQGCGKSTIAEVIARALRWQRTSVGGILSRQSVDVEIVECISGDEPTESEIRRFESQPRSRGREYRKLVSTEEF